MVHEYLKHAQRDAQQTDYLENKGYRIIGFLVHDDLDKLLKVPPTSLK